MPTILHIETATTVCSVALSKDGKLLSIKEQNGDYTHAENLTLFIEDVIKRRNIQLKDLDAIAVSMGPGSYTGLRIGVSVAKGLCYALDKPLIAISTLQHLALSVSSTYESNEHLLFCPMIDARRMEVYYSIFDVQNKIIIPTKAEVIDENSFSDLLLKNKIMFLGNGASKCKKMLSENKNAIFKDDIELSAQSMIILSENCYKNNSFSDIKSFEPFYLKDFLIKRKKQTRDF